MEVRGLRPQEPPGGERRPGQHENGTEEKQPPQSRGRRQRGGMGSLGGRQEVVRGFWEAVALGRVPKALQSDSDGAAEATGGDPEGAGWPRSQARALSITLRTVAPPGSNWDSPHQVGAQQNTLHLSGCALRRAPTGPSPDSSSACRTDSKPCCPGWGEDWSPTEHSERSRPPVVQERWWLGHSSS